MLTNGGTPTTKSTSSTNPNSVAATDARLSAASKKLQSSPAGQAFGALGAIGSGILAQQGAEWGNGLGFIAQGQNYKQTDPTAAMAQAIQQHLSSSGGRQSASAPTGPGSGNGGFLAGQSGTPLYTVPSYLQETPAAAASQAAQAVQDQAPAGLQLGPVPTLAMPTQGYADYLTQAQNALNLGAIGQPYDQAIAQIDNVDLPTAVRNMTAAAQGAQGDIAGGTAAIQQEGQQASANNAAVEAALAQQAKSAAANTASGNAQAAQALGMGSLQGQINSSAAQQNAANQQYLAASAQNNQQTVNATTQAQVADNQGYGRVVDAAKASSINNADLAAQDAKVGIGLSKSQALLAAREQAATNAMAMQQNAVQNALGAYQAKLGGWNALAQYGENQQQYGLQQESLQAQILAAQEGAISGYNTNMTNAEKNLLQYGGTNPAVSGQILQSVNDSAYNDPILRSLIAQGQFAPIPLTQQVLSQYNLTGK